MLKVYLPSSESAISKIENFAENDVIDRKVLELIKKSNDHALSLSNSILLLNIFFGKFQNLIDAQYTGIGLVLRLKFLIHPKRDDLC